MEIKVMHQVMEWNEDVSDAVKAELAEHQVCLINVMGSPGAGKTSMIVSLINRLRETYRIGVIEGDIAGQVDADTIHAMGIPVVQLDTDGACHIEAMSIQHILPQFDLAALWTSSWWKTSGTWCVRRSSTSEKTSALRCSACRKGMTKW